MREQQGRGGGDTRGTSHSAASHFCHVSPAPARGGRALIRLRRLLGTRPIDSLHPDVNPRHEERTRTVILIIKGYMHIGLCGCVTVCFGCTF